MQEKTGTEALYQPVIMEHNRAPLFYEKRPDAQYVADAYNPVCGDKFKLYLDVANGKIVQATFHGYGCAVSKASTSVLMKKIQGVSVPEAQNMIAAFLAALKNETTPTSSATDTETAAFLPARDFPGRLQCATLTWDALEAFFKKIPATSPTF